MKQLILHSSYAGQSFCLFWVHIASLEECLFQGLDHLQFDLRDKISLWLILKPTEKQ